MSEDIVTRLRDANFVGRSLCREAADEIEHLRASGGETLADLTNLYVKLACDADLMRQLTETHPVKQALRSYERIYLGRAEG
jgi:hypothetical protein